MPAGHRGVRVQILRGQAIPFHRDDPGASQYRRGHRKEPCARVQIGDRPADRHALDHVRDEIVQEMAIALEERQHVTPQGHRAAAQREPVGHVGARRQAFGGCDRVDHTGFERP